MATVLNNLSGLKGRSPRVHLCMIVKDEEAVIGRCIESVKPYICGWTIVDTGSTDGTREAIAKAMQGLPGNLFDRPWVDFATNRNEAMGLAGGDFDYLMVIDADEVLSEFSVVPSTGADVYLIGVGSEGRIFPRVWLIRAGYPGRWVGSIHEDLEVWGTWEHTPRGFIESLNDGARFKDPQRTNKDLALLFLEIQKAPMNPRWYYYLGATYWAAGDLGQALKAFRLRLQFKDGDPQEVETIHGLLAQLETA